MAGPRGYTERREVLRRFYALSERDRLAVFEEIRNYLADDLGVEQDSDRLARLRVEALDALGLVADELQEQGQLDEGQAPTAKQFDAVAKQLNVPWTSSRMVRLFGRWRNATAAFLGEDMVEGAWRRRRRQLTGGRERRYEDPLQALRLWLETGPGSLERADFDAFVDNANTARPERPLPRADAVMSALRIPWPLAVRVASGRMTIEAARAQLAEDLLAGLGNEDLVGANVAGVILGHSPRKISDLAHKPHFPRPVAHVANARAWVLGDLRAYADTGKGPEREDNEMQDAILDTRELAERLGMNQNSLVTRVHQESWKKAPPPAGKVGNNLYWWRRDVERWEEGDQAQGTA